MSKNKRGLGDIEFAGTIKTQTFKQFQLQRLIKDGVVIPASKLAESKELELQRIRDFEAAAEDEKRYRRSTSTTSANTLNDTSLTRERFEE